MTLKECYKALGLKEGADLADIKRAYRKLAFSLHPDLNPAVADAAQRFQRVNEAYVTLSQVVSQKGGTAKKSEEASARAREEAQRAYARAKAGRAAPQQSGSGASAEQERGRESVFKDILNDPFARRVFEDIYSRIEDRKHTRGAKGGDEGRSQGMRGGRATAKEKPKAGQFESPEDRSSGQVGIVGKMKGWLRKQIDDEQVLRLPGTSLVPGARVRLEIQHGLSGEPQVLELTLPPEFTPGKPMRLRGMGKRIGNWRGDLYVRIEPV